MTLADLLAELRAARGLSQEDLSARTGVSVRAIGDLERGTTRRPHRETVRALADGLGLDPGQRAAFLQAARAAPPPSTRPRSGRTPGLPAPVTSIVGRVDDVAALGKLIRDRSVRLVTVTGPGGVGKTRLANEIGWRHAGAFERVGSVDLSPLHGADDVPYALATALGCATAGIPPTEAVIARIGDAPWLLVLDSFEHVAGAAAGLADLLAACPRLTALVTSRAPLRLRGEHVWPVSPLPVPDATSPEPADTPSSLAANPAVALLLERTAAVRPGFGLQPDNAADLARLCRRLEGLPLAIELAAAHLRTQTPGQLVAQLESRFTQLSASTVDLPDRHQTLRRTVEWSTERLAAPDRLVLGVLAVFSGGASPDALRAVLAAPTLSGSGLAAGLDASVALLTASSLVSVADRAGSARIGMLDTIREIALDLLTAARLDNAAREAHAAHFLGVVAAAPPDGFDRVDAELDNIRAALGWTTAARPDLLDPPLARALTAYFFSRGQFTEARRTLSALAEAAPGEATRAWALQGAGIAANEAGDAAGALWAAHRSDELFARLGDDPGRCTALTVAGNALKSLGRYDEARDAHRACLALAHTGDDLRRVTIALNNLGTLAHDLGDHAEARQRYAASLDIKRRIGDDRGTAVALMNLGGVDNDLGAYAEAHDRMRRAVELFETVGEQHPLAFALALLAEAQLGMGQRTAAEATANRALAVARHVEYRPAIGLALARLGDLALTGGDPATAERYLREALGYASGAPELARTLEHLAAAVVDDDPAEARRLLTRAESVRRTSRTPSPAADQAMLDRIHGRLSVTHP